MNIFKSEQPCQWLSIRLKMGVSRIISPGFVLLILVKEFLDLSKGDREKFGFLRKVEEWIDCPFTLSR